MTNPCILTPEGRLLFDDTWESERPAADNAAHDVTARAHEYLFEPVEFAPGVTLRSVLKLVADNSVLRAVYQRHRPEDLLAAISAPVHEADLEEGGIDPADVEFAAVYRSLSRHSGNKTFDGLGYVMLHGVGRVATEDRIENDVLVCSKGGRGYYAFELTDARRLFDLPLRLDQEVAICEDDVTIDEFWTKAEHLKCGWFNLGEVLSAVLFELYCPAPKASSPA